MSATQKHPAPSDTRVNILLVEDHPLFRRGLRDLISDERDLVVCGEAAEAAEGLRLVKELEPDLVIIDLSLQRGHGLDLVKQVRARYPGVKLLVCSMHDEALFASRALRAGALGYINKQEAADKVIDAIRSVLRGQVFLTPQMTDHVLHRAIQQDAPAPAIDGLSTRELAVFELIGKGQTTREIAAQLGLSVKTIETYREKIKAKLTLKNGNELICHATQWVLENHG